MIDSKDDQIARLEQALTDARSRTAELESKALELEDALVRAESQIDVLENFCFGLERDHERARRALEDRDQLIFAELEQARIFQQAMLATPPCVSGATLEIAYRPLSQVGGDFYHVAPTSPASLRVFVADATGHGMKAALQTMLIRAEYEAVTVRAGGPAELLTMLNTRIHRAYRRVDVIFTAVVVDIDFATGTARYASAAHPLPFVLRGGRALELPEVGGSFMGLSAESVFDELRASIDPGGALVLVTDGIAEANKPGVGDFGEARILQAMENSDASDGSIAHAVCTALDGFLAPLAPEDDVTLIAVRTPR